MKYLKNYKVFNEEVDFQVEPTDEPDTKVAKDKLSDFSKDAAEFKSKKSQIDSAFSTIKDDKVLKAKLDSLIGKDDKNSFLSDYVHVANLKRKIDTLTLEITKDKLTKDDFNRELSISKDPTIKAAVQSKIRDITNRLGQKSLKINQYKQEINDSEKKILSDISKREAELKDNIEKMEETEEK